MRKEEWRTVLNMLIIGILMIMQYKVIEWNLEEPNFVFGIMIIAMFGFQWLLMCLGVYYIDNYKRPSKSEAGR